MDRSLSALLLCGALLACAPEAPRRQGKVPASDVRWFGALHAIMHEGRTSSAVTLASVVPGPHAWAVGALAGLEGEVTILDDELWLARPKPDGTASLTRLNAQGIGAREGAALLVVANVDAWQERTVQDDVPWATLDAYLERHLRGAGETLERPVPLRIEGRVEALSFHVIDGSKLQAGGGHHDHARMAVSGEIADGEVRMVGFFSRAHEGVFTHGGQHAHFHFVSRDGTLSGHVDSVQLTPGSRLLLPKR